jgi:hypothetical protein
MTESLGLVDESNRDGDHAQVRLHSTSFLALAYWSSCDHPYECIPAGFVAIPSSCPPSIWQRDDALATDGDTSSASSARAFTLLISVLTSRPALLGVSAQMYGVGVPASE